MTESKMPRFLRLKQIIGDPKAIKIGANTTVWREDEVRSLVEELADR